MVEVIFWYLFISLVTTICFTTIVCRPVVEDIFDPDSDPKPRIAEVISNKYLVYLIFLILGFVLSPIVLVIYLVPKYTDRFKMSLYKDLKKI